MSGVKLMCGFQATKQAPTNVNHRAIDLQSTQRDVERNINEAINLADQNYIIEVITTFTNHFIF